MLDYSKMKYRVDTVPLDKNITDEISDIKSIFHDHDLTDTQIRFIILCYSVNSPLLKVDDINARKQHAWDIAGGSEKSDELLEIISYENTTVNSAIICYLKFCDSINHMQLVLQTEALYKCHMDLLTAKAGADKKSTVQSINDLQDLIDRTADKHFKGDDEMANFIPSFALLESRKIYPEERVNSSKIQEVPRLSEETNAPK